MDTTEAYQLNGDLLDFATIYKLWQEPIPLKIGPNLLERIKKGRGYLEQKIAGGGSPIYGINTGFGSLYQISVEGSDLERLQVNLVRSHACGTGASLDPGTVKLMLLFKIVGLSWGHSGVRLDLVERLVAQYNRRWYPRVFDQGSLGASGDLAPLAHLSLPLLGEGELWDGKAFRPSSELLAEADWPALRLKSKEGLALLNGTQFMSALGAEAYLEIRRMAWQADLIAALSLEAYDGRLEPFNPVLHRLRPHRGQATTAARIRQFVEGSSLMGQPKKHVQDPYSLRCIPQVHGASADALDYIGGTLLTEINSVTDNPTIFPDEDMVLSGGNFHGQPLALALDHLALAAAELANISERRTYLLMGGQRGLPPFLVKNAGLNSGLMIAQYTAASLVSQNKQLASPASVDSIPSSNGQEDHVSMGANAATKVLRIAQNLKTVLAIELLCASQALAFRDEKTSPFLEIILARFRSEVPLIEDDRALHLDIARARDFLNQMEVDPAVLFNAPA